jgi:hypothetical protein
MGRALGIAVSRDSIISLSQGSYIDRLATTLGLENAYPVTTPLARGLFFQRISLLVCMGSGKHKWIVRTTNTRQIADMKNSDYRDLVGSVQDATRPDIAFTANKLRNL